jgi:hypothetical protein
MIERHRNAEVYEKKEVEGEGEGSVGMSPTHFLLVFM